jgi:hypothetical protein
MIHDQLVMCEDFSPTQSDAVVPQFFQPDADTVDATPLRIHFDSDCLVILCGPGIKQAAKMEMLECTLLS